jgi:hypothetical protein
MINGLSAQDSKNKAESGKERSRIKKEQRAAKIDSEYRETETLLNSRKFVLEAQSLRNLKGVQVQVSTVLNFISVDSSYAILQIGSASRAGYNGVGGLTEEGPVTNWKFFKDDKRKTFNLSMTVQTNHNTYDVTVMVDYSGNADASLTGMRGGKLTFVGDIVSKENSSMFKGQSH